MNTGMPDQSTQLMSQSIDQSDPQMQKPGSNLSAPLNNSLLKNNISGKNNMPGAGGVSSTNIDPTNQNTVTAGMATG